MGLIIIVCREAMVSRIEEELKNLFDAKWDWKVRKVSKDEYITVFPKRDTLEAFSKLKGIELALYNTLLSLLSQMRILKHRQCYKLGGWPYIMYLMMQEIKML